MAIKDWPLAERPRERLLRVGTDALSDAELLAIVLRVGARGEDAVSRARRLLTTHNGLSGVLDAAPSAPGLGSAAYTQLQASAEIHRRCLKQRLPRGDLLSSPAAVRHFLIARLRDLPHEVFGCLFLDNRHALICYEDLFRGTIDGASVYPREVVKRALALNASALIFAHNHPSGTTEPSTADCQLTARLKTALETVDIRVLDHFVVGDGEPLSFAEQGLL